MIPGTLEQLAPTERGIHLQDSFGVRVRRHACFPMLRLHQAITGHLKVDVMAMRRPVSCD